MDRRISRKGQISLEAGVILLYILIILTTLWLGGPLEQSTEMSTDTNGVLLADQALDTVAANIAMLGFSGDGARKDFVVHVPFNTVDIRYGNSTSTYLSQGAQKTGRHMNMTVVLYSDLGNDIASLYFVDSNGDPSWHSPSGSSFKTAFYYVNITTPLDFPVDSPDYFPFCKERKKSTEIRGNATRFVYVDNGKKPMTFCCEAGFNLNMYVEKSPANPSQIAIKSRPYYSLPGPWRLNPQ
jgi:uncharacterized protein (UPF0333 family)